MKKIILLLLIVATISACHKDDDNDETLPPATQTGAGTFACKINGQSFIDTSGGYFNCYYQLIDGEYFFGIGGNDRDLRPWSIFIQTNAKSIIQGETDPLLENITNNATGGGGFPETLETIYTNQQYTGELTITKLDFTNHIVSGTFWFNIKHPTTGATIEIREGRFDTLFTQ